MKLNAYFTYGLKLLGYRRLDIVLLKKKENRNLFYERILACFFLIVCNI